VTQEPRPDLTVGQLLRDGPVRTLTLAQLAISSGAFLQAAALGKQVYDITGRELDLGWLGLAEFLPAAVLVLVTGPIADRHDRRRVALLALFGEFVCFVALSLYALSEPTAVWPLFTLAAAFGTCRAFAAPALRTMPPMVAPAGNLHRVVALNSATWTSAVVLGPSLSGLLYAVHPAWAFGTAAVLLATGMVGYTTVRFRRQPAALDPDDRPSLHHALEGLRFVRRTPLVLAAISLDLFAVLFGGAVALLPAIAEERLGVGDVAYGFLRAAAGIGAATMAIVLAVRPINRRIGPNLLVAVGVFGVATIVLGLTRSYWIAFAAIIVLSAADMISVYIRSTLVPLVTPDEKRGRVLAVEAVFIGASNELGAFESGVAAAAFGTPFAVVSGGAATVVIVGVWSLLFPDLRRIDRFSELEDLDSERPP
jgi:MFS family permease